MRSTSPASQARWQSVHYDIWHRASGYLTGDRTRYMVKFLFTRMADPARPSWRHEPASGAPLWKDEGAARGGGRPSLPGVWNHQWKWHLGASGHAAPAAVDAALSTLVHAGFGDDCGPRAGLYLLVIGPRRTRRKAPAGLFFSGMPAEPDIKRAVSFIDGQNLYRHAKDAFGHHHPNYDPRKLADAVCADRGWVNHGVRFYTGINGHQPEWATELTMNRLFGTVRRRLRWYL